MSLNGHDAQHPNADSGGLLGAMAPCRDPNQVCNFQGAVPAVITVSQQNPLVGITVSKLLLLPVSTLPSAVGFWAAVLST